MSYQILTTTAASITELKKNPMGTVAEGEGGAVAILNRNEPAFYCVPPELYAYYRELAEDAELNAIADERMKNPDIVRVNLKEWHKLGHTVREQFKKKLSERLKNPRVPAARLHGHTDRYKIKLRASGYRLVYQVIDEKIVLLVIAVGKRESSEVYQMADIR